MNSHAYILFMYLLHLLYATVPVVAGFQKGQSNPHPSPPINDQQGTYMIRDTCDIIPCLVIINAVRLPEGYATATATAKNVGTETRHVIITCLFAH